ncbi:hypothetical protein AB0F74_36945, partial [Nocardia salmonicida]
DLFEAVFEDLERSLVEVIATAVAEARAEDPIVALVIAVSALTLGQFAFSGMRWSNRSVHRFTGSGRPHGVAATTPPSHIKETK